MKKLLLILLLLVTGVAYAIGEPEQSSRRYILLGDKPNVVMWLDELPFEFLELICEGELPTIPCSENIPAPTQWYAHIVDTVEEVVIEPYSDGVWCYAMVVHSDDTYEFYEIGCFANMGGRDSA